MAVGGVMGGVGGSCVCCWKAAHSRCSNSSKVMLLGLLLLLLLELGERARVRLVRRLLLPGRPVTESRRRAGRVRTDVVAYRSNRSLLTVVSRCFCLEGMPTNRLRLLLLLHRRQLGLVAEGAHPNRAHPGRRHARGRMAEHGRLVVRMLLQCRGGAGGGGRALGSAGGGRGGLVGGGHGGVEGSQLTHHEFVLVLLVCVDSLRVLTKVVETRELLAAVAGEGTLAGVFSARRRVSKTGIDGGRQVDNASTKSQGVESRYVPDMTSEML